MHSVVFNFWKENAGMLSPHLTLQLGQENLEAMTCFNEPNERENAGRKKFKNLKNLPGHILSAIFVP